MTPAGFFIMEGKMPEDKKELDDSSTVAEETTTEGKVFDEKYVKELRAENKTRREEIKSLNEKIANMEKSQADRDALFKKSLGLDDNEEDPIAVLKAKVDTLTKGIEESNKNTERERLFNTFVKEALKAGVNPDLVDDAWKLTDGVTFDNVTDAIKGLKEKKGFLFGGNKDVGREIAPGKSDKSYPEMMTAIAQDQKQPVEWIEEKAREYMKKHPEVKSVEQAALRRFGKPTIVGYKPRTE
jgi:hypothetical protein